MLERIDDHDQALAWSGDDPWVRWALPRPLDWNVWRGPGTLIAERRGRRHGLTIIPVPAAADPAVAVDHTLADLAAGSRLRELGVAGVTVPQQHLYLLTRHLAVEPGGDWDWLWTQSQPVDIEAENHLVELDDQADAEPIAALSQVHSPTAEGEPGSGLTELWLGVRERTTGRLIAAGAMQRLASGIPHLAGIVVHRDHRRQGLGAAVTAGLTRAGLADSGVCTLSMYTDNPGGRALYYRLGYRVAWAWASRRLPMT